MTNDLPLGLADDLGRIASALERIVEIMQRGGLPQGNGGSNDSDLPKASREKVGEDWLWVTPEGAPKGTCKDCGKEIRWALTRNGKKVPLDPVEKGPSHYETCPVKIARSDAPPSRGGIPDLPQGAPF